MVRTRLASLALIASAALFASGCMTSSCTSPCDSGGGGFLSRLNLFHRGATGDCCCGSGGDFVVSGAPVATDGPALLVPPQGAFPSNPPPRIITVPPGTNAPNVPYSPTGLKK